VPIVIEDADSIEDLWSRVADAIKDSGLAAAGDRVVLTGGTRLNLPGSTNHILVHTME
jgi:pyruvate kinase